MGQNWENIKSLILGHINAVKDSKNIQVDDIYDEKTAMQILTAEEDAFCKSFDDAVYNILPPVRLISGKKDIYRNGGEISLQFNKRNVLLTRLNSFDNLEEKVRNLLRDYVIAIEFAMRDDCSQQTGLKPDKIKNSISPDARKNRIIRINISKDGRSNKKGSASFVLIKIADDNDRTKLTLDNLYNYLISTNSMLLSDVTYNG